MSVECRPVGFMMECASWSGEESFNIQFVLPKVSTLYY